MVDTQYGIPLILSSFTESAAVGLNRIRLERSPQALYDERWLQKLVSRYPNVLPIEQLEPALTPAISICMELPLASGFVDNLFATPDGDLIVGETKLFRNPEARREVIGQIIDYAKDLSAMSFEALDKAVLKAEAPDGQAGRHGVGLYETVLAAGGRDIKQEQFIDAVSRNLQRGRFLCLVIGDGIQSGTENIAAFLQQHAGMHFTLGLVELALFELPGQSGSYLVQPRILARTRNIDRGVVTIEEGKIVAKPPKGGATGSKIVSKQTTISEEKFFEELESNLPSITPKLKAFTGRLESIDITTEFGTASLILRWHLDDFRAWNLGTILTNGKVWTESVNVHADGVGQLAQSHAYLNELASILSGAYVKKPPKLTSWYVAKDGTYIKIDELISHGDAWINALEKFMAVIRKALSDQ